MASLIAMTIVIAIASPASLMAIAIAIILPASPIRTR